jgi:hypothetical protein
MVVISPKRRERLKSKLRFCWRGCFDPARNEGAFREVEAERPIGCLSEADAGGGDSGTKAAAEESDFRIFRNKNGRVRIAEVRGIELSIDVESDAKFTGTAREGGVLFDGAISAHPIEIVCGFDAADEDGFARMFRTTDRIEAVVESVDEVDVSVAGWSEHGAIAISGADVGVTTGIIGDVSFGFDDGSAGEALRGATE